MSRSNMDDLREVLDKTAQEIAQLDRNPRTWLSWMEYLLERLEAQTTQNSAYMEAFKEMLGSLQDELRIRLKTGGW
jgi:hypothetical protein